MALHAHGHVQDQILATLDLRGGSRGFRPQGARETAAEERSYYDKNETQARHRGPPGERSFPRRGRQIMLRYDRTLYALSIEAALPYAIPRLKEGLASLSASCV